jgi:hypothetical protein
MEELRFPGAAQAAIPIRGLQCAKLRQLLFDEC